MPTEAIVEWGITIFIFALLIGIVGLIPGPLPPPKDEIERFPTEQGGLVDGQQEFDDLIRAFLRELNACQTEEARVECVTQLIFGVIVGARRALRTDAESEKNHDGSQPNVWTN